MRNHCVHTSIYKDVNGKPDPRRFKMGTQAELSDALQRTWQSHPTPERIVEDIMRMPATIKAIIKCQGGVLDDVKRKGRRKERAKRPFVPHPDCNEAMKLFMKDAHARIKAAKRAKKNR